MSNLLSRLFLVAAAYYLAGRIGLSLASFAGQVTLIWPPTGIALFALLAWGTRLWPAVWVAAFLVNLPLDSSLPANLVIATGNTLGPLLGAVGLNRLGFRRGFTGSRDVVLYAGVGALAGMAVNALVGATTLVADGVLPAALWPKVWLTWWLGDALGALFFGPILLILQAPDAPRVGGTSGYETALAWGGLVASAAICTTPLSPFAGGLPAMLAFPFAIWLALRQNAVHAAGAALALGAMALSGVLMGVGPFVDPQGQVELAQLWTYLFIVGFASLLITTLRSELALALQEARGSAVALRRAATEWTLAMDAFDDAIYLLDPQRRLLRANRAFYELIHSTPERAVGRPIVELVHPGGESVPCPVCRAQMEHRDTFITLEADHPDNPAKCPIEVRVKMVRDDAGEPTGILMGIHDLTASREHDAELREAHERLQLTQFGIDHVSDAVYLIDGDARLHYVNQEACRRHGLECEALLRMRISDLDPNYPLERWPDHFREVKKEHFMTFETLHRCRDGSLIPVEVASSHIHYADAEYIFAFSRDIAERKRIEEELNRHRAHLEQLVESRTADLKEAKEAAEAANRAKSVFLANMSHELRTPLNAILGFTQMMVRDGRIPADLQQDLGSIKRSGQHLLALINDVLELSRIEAGRLVANPEALDLHQLLATLTEVAQVRTRPKGLAFHLAQAENLPRFVHTDLVKLRQILFNLISNAVKFTERGSIGVSARCSREGEQWWLSFDVTDTGAGIAGDELERVFEAFYQTENGIATGEGTGLGLAISREYAHLLGGELSVESAPGRGSVFHFHLPVQLVEPSAVVQRVEGRVIELAPGQPRFRILVAEDNPDNRRLIVALLERVGLEVRAVTNGQQAVEAFTRWHPHFIWMDMRMPVMDGYEATRRIRTLPGGSRVKIAALTASAFEEDRSAVLAAGCDGFVRKPLQEEALFRGMHELLGVRYLYTEPAATDGGTVADELRPENLSPLPADLLAALEEAALGLNVEELRLLIERIRPLAAPVAKSLAGLADEFRFDEILTAVRAARAPESG